MDDVVGNLINYDILSEIGKGTYGTVLLCKKQPDSKIVVLKKVSGDSSCYESLKEAQNEIKILSTLDHPFVIKYFESFNEDKSVFICMEYANNGNLAEYMYKRHHYLLPQNEILFFFCQILLGVQHIHSKKIIHRDLKAENILMSGPHGNVVKIGDFGIAKILENKKANTVIGTPYYLAPELCENKPYDSKTDVWAIGCLLYEMCTHNRAFESTTLLGLVQQIVSGDITPINMCYYDRELQEVIDSMLTVVPEKRCSIDDIMQKKVLKPMLKYLNHVLFFLRKI